MIENNCNELNIRYSIFIKKIVVMLTDGTDRVSLYTNLPNSYPLESNEDLIMEFRTKTNFGIEYVREHFGREPEVINVRTR